MTLLTTIKQMAKTYKLRNDIKFSPK